MSHTGTHSTHSTTAAAGLDQPHITARFHPDRVEVAVEGEVSRFTTSDGVAARSQALRFLKQLVAEDVGHAVRVHTYAEDETYARLVVTPAGEHYDENMDGAASSAPVEDVPEEPSGSLSIFDDPAPTDSSASATRQQRTSHSNLSRGTGRSAEQSADPEVLDQVPNRRAARTERESFIRAGRAVEPATRGWRGALNRMGFRLPPGPTEIAYRGDVTAVCRHWPGPKTIAIANPKGSSGKTPAAVMLSAVLARYGGAGVLAWDNNETRGSLAWRTQQASHDATVLDLLPRVEDLLATGAQSAEMSHWTHHQPADKYDVLHSDQSVEGDHEVTGVDVEQIHQVARRYYRLVLMDSGNNERAANWRAMMRRADALVVPCTNVEDTAEAAALMLEALASRDEHSEALADNAVVIVSQRTPGRDRNIDRIVKGLTPLVREVVRIPFDPALVSGVISFDALRPETQRAWLRAAAAVARGL